MTRTSGFRWALTLILALSSLGGDEVSHRVFIVTREPVWMAVFDTNSGSMVAALPWVQNSDDLYYDSVRKRIYVGGGEGYVSVFQQ